MPHTTWKGSLNVGLVNIPVGLYGTTRGRSVHFNRFEAGTSDRIRYRKVNERTGREVDASHIVKGVDVGGDEYVLLSDEELERAEAGTVAAGGDHRVPRPGRDRPVFFRASY